MELWRGGAGDGYGKFSYVNVGHAINRLKGLSKLTILEKAFSIIVIHVQGTLKCKNIGTLEDDCEDETITFFSLYT